MPSQRTDDTGLVEVVPFRQGVVLARVRGEVDLSNAPAVEAEVALRLRGAQAVVFDLDGVDFVDVAGMRAVIRATEACVLFRCLVAAPESTAARVARLGRFDGHVPIVSSLTEAAELVRATFA